MLVAPKMATRFTCFNSTEIALGAPDLCFFGGFCDIDTFGDPYCICPPGYGPDTTLFVNTRNCALPVNAIQIYAGVFAFSWLVVLVVTLAQFASTNSRHAKTMRNLALAFHVCLLLSVVSNAIHNGMYESSILFSTLIYWLLMIIVTKVAQKMFIFSKSLFTDLHKVMQRRFAVMLPFATLIVFGTCFVAMAMCRTSHADILITVWFASSYLILDVYFVVLFRFTNRFLAVLDATEVERRDEIMKKVWRMKALFGVFFVVTSFLSIVFVVVRFTLGSLPFCWTILLPSVGLAGNAATLAVGFLYSKDGGDGANSSSKVESKKDNVVIVNTTQGT
jgi:hypothetical protein